MDLSKQSCKQLLLNSQLPEDFDRKDLLKLLQCAYPDKDVVAELEDLFNKFTFFIEERDVFIENAKKLGKSTKWRYMIAIMFLQKSNVRGNGVHGCSQEFSFFTLTLNKVDMVEDNTIVLDRMLQGFKELNPYFLREVSGFSWQRNYICAGFSS